MTYFDPFYLIYVSILSTTLEIGDRQIDLCDESTAATLYQHFSVLNWVSTNFEGICEI